MSSFVIAIFLSAFLLFQVQPIVARVILPWYGGSPAVWTTCMLFFQAGLLVGYGYAHALASLLRRHPSWQCGIHAGLVLLSLLSLPVMPPESWKPITSGANPVGGILLLLARTVGLPYLVISASGPLLQHWFARAAAGRSPYRLYAVSNAGSLIGLISYPFLVEPSLRLGQQSWLWTGGYLVYGVLVAACGWVLLRRAPCTGEADRPGTIEQEVTPAGSWTDRFLWVALAACGSMLLLSTTNQMCQDVAVVPFLWVLPLSLYLISFILSFDHSRWYRRLIWMPYAAVSVGAVMTMIYLDVGSADLNPHLALQVVLYCFALFSGCMVCHGELVRLKPASDHLTGFYLAISLGGALGGMMVSLVAPQLFSGYWEFYFALVLLAGLMVLTVLRDRKAFRWAPLAWSCAGFLLAGAAMLIMTSLWIVRESGEGVVARARSFYGVLRIKERSDLVGEAWLTERSLLHGRISHGRQYPGSDLEHLATTYYSEGSGPDALFASHQDRQKNGPPLKYGVIGLGTGTLAAYARDGDTVRIYEINPQVERFSRTQFTYLRDCQGTVEVVPGDARISLAQELAAGNSGEFDFLFVDAFSGDAIPIHLITREACELYFRHLKPGGVLAIHTTNTHLNLTDPVRTMARTLEADNLQVEHVPEPEGGGADDYSQWVLVSRNQEFLNQLRKQGWATEWEREAKNILWTDDYSNLWQVLNWND